MHHKIVRRIPRPDAEAVKVLGELGVATIHEAQGRTGAMLPYLRPIYPAASVAGPAITVLCHPGDNLMIHASVEVCKPGDVLVVVTTSESNDGMFGDLLATSCQAHGVTGLVIDAGVRDTAELTAMKFPVWAKAVSPQGTVKANITAQLIIVEGTVEGDLHADKSVFVKDTAKVHGNIFAPTVSIQEGASFSGSIDMDGKSGQAAAKPDTHVRALRTSGGAA